MTTTLEPTSTSIRPRSTAVRFVSPLPGLEEYSAFSLIGIDDMPVYMLQSTEEPALALPVAEGYAVHAGYSFELSTADALSLDLQRAEDALVLVVLTVPQSGGEITANLFAPIVINRRTYGAKQVILEGTQYSLHHAVKSWRE
jgi:flagellar assembly factor FliW